MADVEAGRHLCITYKLHSVVTELTSSRSKQMILFETIAITSICFMVSLLFRPNDPLCLEASYPWLLLVPLLIALGFGLLPGLLSIALIIASGVALSDFSQLDVSTLPMGYLLGGLFMTVLTGEFRDFWHKKMNEANHDAGLQSRRYHQLERNYHALKASHDAIESKFVSDPNSLRRAFHSAKAALSGKQSGFVPATAEIIVELLNRYGDVSDAGLFAVNTGEVDAQPLACAGDFGQLEKKSGMLQECLQTRKTISKRFDTKLRKQNNAEPYLACIPMLDVNGQLAAVYIVKNMAFYSFQARTLNLMSILAASIADSFVTQQEAHDSAHPSPALVGQQILRLVNHLNEFQVPAMALAASFDKKSDGDIFQTLLGDFLRDTDTYFTHRQEKSRFVLILKLTDVYGLHTVLERLESAINIAFGHSINIEDIVQATYSITETENAYERLSEDLGLNSLNDVQTSRIPRSSAA